MKAFVTLMFLGAASTAHASWFPNVGDLTYDGSEAADVVFKWDKPELVPADKPNQGFEMDFVTTKNYFSRCETQTTMPDAYDDCPTAHVLDSPYASAYGFGTFSLAKIEKGVNYTGLWRFYKASRSPLQGTFFVNAQATYRGICRMENIWCMLSFRGRVLLPMHGPDPKRIDKLPIRFRGGRSRHVWRLNANDRY